MGTDSILFYLLTYLFANLGAFADHGDQQFVGHRRIDDYRGLNRRSPFLAFAMLIFLLSLAGVPPLARLHRQTLYLCRRDQRGLYTLITVGLVNIVVSMYYYLIVVKNVHQRTTRFFSHQDHRPLRAVIYVGLAGTLVIGIYPQPFLDWAVSATRCFRTSSVRPRRFLLRRPRRG